MIKVGRSNPNRIFKLNIELLNTFAGDDAEIENLLELYSFFCLEKRNK